MFSMIYRSGRDGRSRGLRTQPHSQESIGPVVVPAVAASASVTSATDTSTATPTGGAVGGAVAGGGGAEALSPDKRRQRALTQAPSPGRPFRRSNDLTGEWSRFRGTRF